VTAPEVQPGGTVSTFGGRLEELRDGYARIRYPFDRRWCNPKGTLQGGVLAVYLDDCMGYAILGSRGADARFSTVSLTVGYLRPVGGGDVVAIGRVVRAGRQLATLEGDILDDAGRLVARGMSSVVMLPRAGSAVDVGGVRPGTPGTA